MPGYAVKRIDEMEGAYRGALKKARAELGVTSFGLQVIDFPPNADRYPEHDHSSDGQEEVYAVLRGSGEIVIDGERVGLDPDELVRVSAGVRRKILAGPQGLRVLAIGGVPGAAYEIREYTELGAADPAAGGSRGR
ncbi:MAG TPA: cupin domain-containing protein [Thermoleophilaceae bacterium]|nr:cupin domain-containing protein [Thermoleophilaceae bacterium]